MMCVNIRHMEKRKYRYISFLVPPELATALKKASTGQERSVSWIIKKAIKTYLEKSGFLKNGHLHLDVFKIPHHGSENNMDAEFCRHVSADHYVFCGNGEHGNPEPEVLEIIYNSRFGPAQLRTQAPEAENRPFKFWFSTTSDHQKPGSQAQRNFVETEEIVARMVRVSNGLMKTEFNRQNYRTLTP